MVQKVGWKLGKYFVRNYNRYFVFRENPISFSIFTVIHDNRKTYLLNMFTVSTKSNQFKDQKWLTCKLEGWSHFWTIEQASLCRHRWVLSNYMAIQPNSLELQKRIFRELKKKKNRGQKKTSKKCLACWLYYNIQQVRLLQYILRLSMYYYLYCTCFVDTQCPDPWGRSLNDIQ